MTHFSPRSFSLKTEMHGFYLRLPFQLATPPRFHASHIPTGNLVHIHKINLGRCERILKFRIYLQLCLGLRTPSLLCLRACFFDRFPRWSCEPASDECSPMRASRSISPPTCPATPKLRGICWKKETRTFYFLWSWKFVEVLLLREELFL